MANTKEYSIKINGLTESINAVDSLNKQLDKLEQRMKTISSAKVSTGGGSSRGASSELSEEERVQKEINKLKQQGQQLDAKILAAQDEIYKRVDATKELYKETIADQKALAAQERLSANAYSNTMVGMKQQLADLKAVIQTTDLGDSDGIKKMTEQANELTNKLKQMEEAYGQFGRNVGNYQSAFGKYKIEVGGVTREFDNAKQAAKILSNELLNLPKGAKGAEELHQALLKVRSDIKDLGTSSSVMDNLLDTMESITAIANVGQGIRGLFGIDDAEMQKSIKNLVALQNVLKGIETINKQLKTGEGIGAWIKPFNTGIDKATTRLLVFNRAVLGTGTAAKTAAIGINLFSKALKLAFTGGILIAVDYLVEKLMGLVESFKKVDQAAEDAKEAQKDVAKAYAEGSATLLKYQTIVNNFNGTKKQEKKLIDELNSELGTSLGTYKTLAEWMDVLTKKGEEYINMLVLQAKAQAAFNRLVKAQEAEMNAKEASTEDYRTFVNDIQDFLWTGWGTKSANKARVAGIQAAKAYTEGAKEALTDAQKEVQEYMKAHNIGDYSPQIEKNASKMKKSVSDAENELTQLRIANMKEGLNKTIKQLEEERKQKLAKVVADGRMIAERQAEINKYYDQKILEAKNEWAKKVEKTYMDMWDKIYAYSLETSRKIGDLVSQIDENKRNEIENSASEYFNQGMSSYGVQGKNQLSRSTRIELEYISTGDDEFIDDMKKSIDMMRDAQIALNAYGAAVEKFESVEKDLSDEWVGVWNLQLSKLEYIFNKKKQEYEDEERRLIEKYGSEKYYNAQSLLLQESYSSKLSKIYEQRFGALENYWAKRSRIEISAATANYNAKLQIENEQFEAEKRENQRKAEEIAEIYKKAYENEEITMEEHSEILRRNVEEFNRRYDAIVEQHNQNLIKLKNEKNNRIKQINGEAHKSRLQELRDFQTAISNLESKQPVYDSFGIINLGKTAINNKNLLDSYKTLANQIVGLKKQLQAQLDAKQISFDDFQNANRELDSFAENVGQKMDEVKRKLTVTDMIGQFGESINKYFQLVGQSIEQIMQSVWDYQDYMLEKEQDDLDKENEELEKKLDEQEDIVQKHKDAIDSIEDELATSRGDRRQHLIDQLNAEIAAQRAAAAEKKKIEKEQEAAEKRQEALDKKRREQEYKRNVAQAFISWHLSIANGLATQPFMPVGIAMGALATALGAVQYALVKSQKPYATGGQLDGGVAQGKRHSEGGIPVLGGRASIEGGEFITNRQTTAKNVDLLEYINSKKKKVDLDDLIDFYNSGKTRKNIQSVRRMFADGGTLPTLPSQLDIQDQLQNIVVNQDNRPIYVSVVDINNKQDDVRRVQTLAGL